MEIDEHALLVLPPDPAAGRKDLGVDTADSLGRNRHRVAVSHLPIYLAGVKRGGLALADFRQARQVCPLQRPAGIIECSSPESMVLPQHRACLLTQIDRLRQIECLNVSGVAVLV
jgi:hypothetical protein